MMKAMSKNDMILKIDDICSITRKAPVVAARIVRCQEDSIGYMADDMDTMMENLAGLSLTHSIIEVGCMVYPVDGRSVSIVRFFLSPEADYTTNIDAEVLEHVVKLEWICES